MEQEPLEYSRRALFKAAGLAGVVIAARNILLSEQAEAKIPTSTIVNPNFAKGLGRRLPHHWQLEGDTVYNGNLIKGEVLVGLRYSKRFGLEGGSAKTQTLLDSDQRNLELVVKAVNLPNEENDEAIFPAFSVKFLRYLNERGGRTEEVGNAYYEYPVYGAESGQDQTITVFKTGKNGSGHLFGGEEFVIPKQAQLIEIALQAYGGFKHDGGNADGRHFGFVKYTSAVLRPSK